MLATSMVVGTAEEAGVLFPQKVVAATDEEDYETVEDFLEPTEDRVEPTEDVGEPEKDVIEPTEDVDEPAKDVTEPTEDVGESAEGGLESTGNEDASGDYGGDYEYIEPTEDGFVITKEGVLVEYKGKAKEVVIPDNVTAIGDFAFSGTVVEKVSIPDSVTAIGNYAFGETDLEKITIPDSVTELGDNVFNNCGKLKEVVIGNGIKVIPGWTFSQNKALERVSLSEGIREIGENAFCGATALQSINLPKGLTTIGDLAFDDTPALKTLDLPEGLTTIGEFAFTKSGITEITIPGSVTDWKSLSFFACDSLSTVVIKDGVSKIPEGAFWSSEGLSKVTFPNSGLEEGIGEDAFHGTNLTEADIPSCGYLGDNALGEKMQKVRFGSGVKKLGEYLFAQCKDLESVELSYGLEAIGGNAFSNTKITSIDIPNSVAIIGDSAFSGCGNLEHVTLPGNLKYLGSDAFSLTKWKDNLEEKMKAEGKLYLVVENVMLGNQPQFVSGEDTELSLPNEQSGDVTAIGELEMNGVKKLKIKEGIISVGRINEMYGTEEIDLADTVTRIGRNFLWGNNTIRKVKLSNMIADIPSDAFWGCKALEEVEMPKNLSTIQYGAFWGCTALKQLTIPDTVTTIAECAFAECSNLSELTIPAGVNFIGDKAFETGNADFVLKVYQGSYAQEYAEENGIAYEVIGTMDPLSETKTVKASGIVKKKGNETPLAEGEYRITLDPMEGLCPKESIVVKNEEAYKVLPSVSKTGMTFSGWYTEPEGGVKVENTTIVNLSSDMTLYAHFVESNLKVKFNENGGQLESRAKEKNIRVGEVYGSLPTPTKEKSAFVGWYTQPAGGQIVTEDMVVELSGECNLYAHWISTDQNIDFDSLHFDFSNSRADYGYENPYRIPLAVFRYLYGKNPKAQAMYDEWPNWGGSCFGMVASAMMLNMSGDSMELKDFDSSYTKNSDVKTDSVNKVNLLSLTRFIETLHIAQRENGVARDKDSHIDDFAGIKKALEAAQSKEGLPIILSLHSATSGHAVVAYKMDKDKIYIYDPNYPDEERTIAIKKDSRENIVNWSYTINNVEPCGTGVEGSWISYYTMESVIKAWEKRNSQYYSSEILIGSNSKDFKVYSSAGTEVAAVVNGELNTPYSDVYLCDSDEDKGKDDRTKIYLPVGTYVVENTGKESTFEVSVLGTERSIVASTQAKKLTVDLVDRKSESECSISPINGAGYSITMESSALGDKKKVSVSGTSAGNEVQVEQHQGMLAFENCDGNVQVDNKSVSLVQVNASANAGGSISRQGAKSVIKGEDTVYAITPQYGYMVSDVKVDGESIGNVSTYTFKNINQQHSIDASFEKVSFANLSAITLEEVKKGVLPKLQIKLGKQILTEKDDYICQISGQTNKEIKIKVIGQNLYAGQSTEVTFAVGTDAGTEKQNDGKEEEKKKQSSGKLQGKVETVEGIKYKITNVSKKTVTVTKRVSSKKKVVIPAVVIIDDKTYKVTAIANGVWKKDKKLQSVTIGKNVTKIGSKAFSGAAKLKTITIKSKKISSVGAGAFSGIAQNAVVKVPSAKKRTYSKLFAKKGLPSKAKWK